MRSVHLDGTRNVLDAAHADACVVHTSSLVTVGGSPAGLPVTEDAPFDLEDLRVDYVQAKRRTEQFALDAARRGRRVILTNPGYLVGPEDYEYSIMGRVCRRFWKGRLPLIPAQGGLNLVDVRDVATGHLLAAEHGRPGRRYLLGGENRSFPEFMSLLAETAAGARARCPARPHGCSLSWPALRRAGPGSCTGSPIHRSSHCAMNRYYWFCQSDRAARLGYRVAPSGRRWPIPTAGSTVMARSACAD